MSKTILVTGGAGFLGSNLCKLLLSNGDNVICLDNLYTCSLNNIKDLLDNPSFKFVEHDVVEPYHFNVDQIYNLACPASPPHYQKDPIKTIFTSFYGIKNALDLANDLNIPILQASTSEVYGDPKISPQIESYWGNVNPIGKRSCYDEGKRIAETLMIEYHRKYKTKIKIARIFNTYGPGMDPDDGRVVSNFIIECLNNKELSIYGDGTQTRSFCFVSDLIRGLYLLMNSDSDIIGPINIGNPEEHTINYLADKIKSMTESTSVVTHLPLPSDDPTIRNPDISLAREKLNWKPEVSLEDGLRMTIDYFSKLKG